MLTVGVFSFQADLASREDTNAAVGRENPAIAETRFRSQCQSKRLLLPTGPSYISRSIASRAAAVEVP